MSVKGLYSVKGVFMIYFLLYIISISGKMSGLFLILGLGASFFGLALVLMQYMEYGRASPTGVKMLIVATIFGVISALIPNKSGWALILGGGVAYDIITSDTTKEIGNDVLDILKSRVEEQKALTNK